MLGNIYVNSELAEGELLHPTLPVAYFAETINIPNPTSVTNSATIEFQTQGFYTKPFFQVTTTRNYSFYVEVVDKGTGRDFVINLERAYYYLEGRRYYSGEGNPLYTDMIVRVGAERG